MGDKEGRRKKSPDSGDFHGAGTLGLPIVGKSDGSSHKPIGMEVALSPVRVTSA